MDLNIRDIDPETRGFLYRLQAERNMPNLKETLKFMASEYFRIRDLIPVKRIGSELCACGHSEAAHDDGGCLGNGATCMCSGFHEAEARNESV